MNAANLVVAIALLSNLSCRWPLESSDYSAAHSLLKAVTTIPDLAPECYISKSVREPPCGEYLSVDPGLKTRAPPHRATLSRGLLGEHCQPSG